MRYDLPKTAEIGGAEYAVRTDYRVILDIIEMISDPELGNDDKAQAMVEMFYPDYKAIPYALYGEAVNQCISFINCGDDDTAHQGPRNRFMDWQQDFPLIASPINHVLGFEIRSRKYLHWWTFIGAYQEIGDCTFAQVVNIREKKRKNQKLDKAEQEFYKRNKHLVDFKRKYSDADDQVVAKWT